MPFSPPSVAQPTRPSPSVLGLSDDHLRVLFDDASGVGDLVLADVAITAYSHRRGEVGEDAWWLARRRCADAWEHLAARLPVAELDGRLARVTADRLEREVAHLWHGRPRDADHADELLLWVAVDRTRSVQASRAVRTLNQVAEGEDVFPVTLGDASEIRTRVADVLRVATSRRDPQEADPGAAISGTVPMSSRA